VAEDNIFKQQGSMAATQHEHGYNIIWPRYLKQTP